MKVSDVYLSHQIATTSPNQTVERAALELATRRVGVLTVVSDASLLGILTERDVVRVAADGVHPASALVREYTTGGPVAVSLDSDVSDAVAILLRTGTRDVPVIDEGRVVGTLSVHDVLRSMARLTYAA